MLGARILDACHAGSGTNTNYRATIPGATFVLLVQNLEQPGWETTDRELLLALTWVPDQAAGPAEGAGS